MEPAAVSLPPGHFRRHMRKRERERERERERVRIPPSCGPPAGGGNGMRGPLLGCSTARPPPATAAATHSPSRPPRLYGVEKARDRLVVALYGCEARARASPRPRRAGRAVGARARSVRGRVAHPRGQVPPRYTAVKRNVCTQTDQSDYWIVNLHSRPSLSAGRLPRNHCMNPSVDDSRLSPRITSKIICVIRSGLSQPRRPLGRGTTPYRGEIQYAVFVY